jgi:hypothetical protein
MPKTLKYGGFAEIQTPLHILLPYFRTRTRFDTNPIGKPMLRVEEKKRGAIK